jgi:hypothetical protein
VQAFRQHVSERLGQHGAPGGLEAGEAFKRIDRL